MIYGPGTYSEARARLEYLAMEKKTIELKEYRKKRTLNQNNGYWLWLTYLQEETGTDKEVYHGYFINRFPTRVEIEINGKREVIQITTSHPLMNTARMNVYMNRIEEHASLEFGISLPDLKSKEALQMYEYYKEKGLI